MVTVIVGGRNGSTMAKVVTTTDIEEEKRTEFDIKSIAPGSSPKYE